MTDKPVYAVFADVNIESDFEKLKGGKFQDRRLYDFISRAIEALKENPAIGIKLPKYLWPKIYVEKYSIINLWK